jgi:hypothetical protein
MKTLKVYGSRDYLINFSGIEGANQFSVYSDNLIQALFLVKSLEEEIYIIAFYDEEGNWSFEISLSEECLELPNWSTRIYNYKNGYSTCLEIDVPDDTVLTRILDNKLLPTDSGIYGA